jgi:hypothetical protein
MQGNPRWDSRWDSPRPFQPPSMDGHVLPAAACCVDCLTSRSSVGGARLPNEIELLRGQLVAAAVQAGPDRALVAGLVRLRLRTMDEPNRWASLRRAVGIATRGPPLDHPQCDPSPVRGGQRRRVDRPAGARGLDLGLPDLRWRTPQSPNPDFSAWIGGTLSALSLPKSLEVRPQTSQKHPVPLHTWREGSAAIQCPPPHRPTR